MKNTGVNPASKSPSSSKKRRRCAKPAATAALGGSSADAANNSPSPGGGRNGACGAKKRNSIVMTQRPAVTVTVKPPLPFLFSDQMCGALCQVAFFSRQAYAPQAREAIVPSPPLLLGVGGAQWFASELDLACNLPVRSEV